MDSTYTLTDSDEGKAIKVKVSFTDDANNEETLTSAATGVVAAEPNSLATGAPTISGTAQVGETLTADLTNGITDEDGLDQRFLQLPVDQKRQRRPTDTDIQEVRQLRPTPCPTRTRTRPSRSESPSPTTPTTSETLDQRGDGGGCGQAQLSGHGSAHHHWHGPGGRDADSGHVSSNRRLRRADQRFLQLPVGFQERQWTADADIAGSHELPPTPWWPTRTRARPSR